MRIALLCWGSRWPLVGKPWLGRRSREQHVLIFESLHETFFWRCNYAPTRVVSICGSLRLRCSSPGASPVSLDRQKKYRLCSTRRGTYELLHGRVIEASRPARVRVCDLSTVFNMVSHDADEVIGDVQARDVWNSYSRNSWRTHSVSARRLSHFGIAENQY